MRQTRLFIFFSFFLHAISFSQPQHINLSGKNWVFAETGSDKWYPAAVPGCVHTDLLANQIIPDPFFGDNEKEVRWVEQKNWDYKTSFDADNDLLAHDRISLIFEGLDTYAEVFLNGKLILSSNNMFRRWEAEIKNILKPGSNELLITFSSASARAKAEYGNLPAPLPYDERVMVRKAQYQFGWDWGPRLVTAGIWRPIKIEAWNKTRFHEISYSQKSLDKDKAELVFHAAIESEKETDAVIEVAANEGGKFKQNIRLYKGITAVDIPYTLEKPQLWWPNGLGEQNLYSFEVSLKDGQSLLDKSTIVAGLRTIDLVQEKDSAGKSFYFKVNGIPVFIKGANYIPQDNFLPRVTRQKYKRLISDAAGCRMNMLRVWGGGVYEDDYFYALCDSMGILVWQDFMFACAMYPGDSAFIENVSNEINDNVCRLRNHPCMALWCGNNEIDEGWHNWGMQKQFNYGDADSSRIWQDYLALFHASIPAILERLDHGRTYLPSSPVHGWGRKESMTEGDAHYWGVWWGDEAFEVYLKKVPRFMSEYGFQGFPDLRTLDSCLKPEDRRLVSDALKNHEKHPRGFELINSAMQRYYKVPKDYREFATQSQYLQARAMRIAIEAQRRAKPYCMGTLYWQLNDCWPVISWSGIDYDGCWKAAQYEVKRAYATVLISPVAENGMFRIYVISDSLRPVNAKMEIIVVDNTGKKEFSETLDISVDPLTSKVVYEKPYAAFTRGFDTTKCAADIRLRVKDSGIACASYFFCKPVNFKHTEGIILTDYKRINDFRWRLDLTPDGISHEIYLESQKAGIRFSDNYFDLMPNRTKTIMITSDEPVDDIQSIIRLR